jgi:hypothetical protein
VHESRSTKPWRGRDTRLAGLLATFPLGLPIFISEYGFGGIRQEPAHQALCLSDFFV